MAKKEVTTKKKGENRLTVAKKAVTKSASKPKSKGKSTQPNQGNVDEVKIGKQVWMVTNLNVTHFRNGDAIPEVKTDDDWFDAMADKKPAMCYYSNNKKKGSEYGVLYNWYAVTDPRGIAPEGWEVPSDKDWDELVNNLGGEDFAGDKLKHNSLWAENKGGNGNGSNGSGFTALPGGYRSNGGDFEYLNEVAFFWSSSIDSGYYAWYYKLFHYNGTVCKIQDNMGSGCSVRCLKKQAKS